MIDGLAPEDVNTMYKSIHFPENKQKYFDVPLYCRPLRKMTHTKDSEKKNSNDESETILANKIEKTTKEPETIPAAPSKNSSPEIPGLYKSQHRTW